MFGATSKPRFNRQTKLINTLDKRPLYFQLKEDRPALADKLIELDILLESLLEPCEQYDKGINNNEDVDKLSEWGTRIMRMRYVLGVD